MSKPLLGEKIAVLVANGFSEQDLTLTQKALMQAGGNVRIVGMDNGLVNSWDGSGWGLNFAVDQVLSAALAVDYTMLLVPGGQRSIDKLQLTAHTKRFVNGFLNAEKPVAVFGEALCLVPPEKVGESFMTSGPSEEGALEGYAQDVIEFFIKSVKDAGPEAVAA